MNNIAKRMIAGVSAAALFVSAVGFDAFTSLFMGTSYAESVGAGKNGRSTGFSSLEQDTSGEYYNTGYGLHTNKTAKAVGTDGRTFDVNLESWYVGENPVDVATILDASGSMAWTVNTLDPLKVDAQLSEDDKTYLTSKYSTDDLAEIQKGNGGYLPQDVVDKILDNTKTDNSKLSYAGYKYYVYEARSSVSEFVPLGYWDGETGKIDRNEAKELIGRYDFNGTDKWKNLKSESNGMTSVGESNPGTSSGNNYLGESGNAVQIGKTIDDKHKGMKLDVSPTVSDGSFEFTLSFAIKGNKNSGIKNWEIFRFGNDTKYWCIKVPSVENGLAVRNQSDGGPTNGSKNVFDNTYAFYSFVFYKDANNKLNYRLYKNGTLVRDVYDNKGASGKNLGDFNDLITSDNKVNITFDTSTAKGEGTIYVDDIYFFDKALTEEEVKNYFGDGESAAGLCEATTYNKDGSIKTAVYHAKMKDGDETIDIAQISSNLYDNPSAEERKGWYYVNSHSNWADIEGCLQSGKQYIGIVKEDDKNADEGEKVYSHEDVATTPNSEYDFTDGDKQHDEYVAPDNERSIRFYVDDQNHLRCFVHAGGTSKENDPRTFCSVVYKKEDKQQTKYEALDDALDSFYSNLAKGSDLSNSAIIRFSTHNLMADNVDEHLKSLILKNWTNWSDYYRSLTEEEKNGKTNEELKEGYMQNLLIPDKGETSLGVGENAKDTGEYPYVMTGGTYTWTGLKAFYDNMVKKDGLESGNRVYDIANDARDKYLIIFTDGRDNTVGTSDEKYNNYGPSGEVSQDSELAKAWADKLKEEGYTIFCVMMAAGSISPTANEEEYEKAYDFVTTLAGEKADDENAANYVSVIGAGAGAGSVDNVEKAFDNILKQIQQPRNDYTVQDYIDPRFDLVDIDGNLYHLGAGGKITVTKNGTPVTGLNLSNGTTFTSGNAVGNIIESKEGESPVGLAYTPQNSYMVNRKPDATEESGYTDGDGKGTGYIYYDDVKDMYYLRWTDQIIPMENEVFDTDTDPKNKTLDVWSATIRLKAKDDFIGGNNILTNGNEAGENLVFSEATIENMDKDDNYELYGFTEDDLDKDTKKVPYRKKLEALSGTNRKINAVDAGGVSQAVYGNGIDIPSSGFPRVTVNVRLKPLDAKNLNDVIYMGEVVSPTMMLADLENGYMTGSYYLEYLERYAYRVYGEGADQMPLIELLNKWLKIDDKKEASKTFTIPYIYLPAPEYKDGKLVKDSSSGKVNIQNSTGASWQDGNIDFDDLNLRDVTGFITYTWKRDDGSKEPQQKMEDETDKYDITKEYVVKNTNQIKYNLQLKFTPLKEEDLPEGFKFDDIFIKGEGGTLGDKFFKIENKEFAPATEWSIESNRSDYLQAMVKEEKTYQPHVMYDTGSKKWVLVDDKNSTHTTEKALEAYSKDDDQITTNSDETTLTDKGVYDWDTKYKKVAGEEQIEGDKLDEYYTDTLNNVGFADKDGNTITDETGKFTTGKSKTDVCSLVANTTYVKDVVNGALALELVVDGKYLGVGSAINPSSTNKTYTFEATRYYDDPIDPLPYGTNEKMNADTGAGGKKYQLTFTVDKKTLPKDPKENQLYTVWAKLTEVKVEVAGGYQGITSDGYAVGNALPIGTYVIGTTDNPLTEEQFRIGKDAYNNDVKFQYLKTDNAPASYTYNRFPESVYNVSKTAPVSTGDGEYLIKNGSKDNSQKNIADSNRTKDNTAGTQTLTFKFGTVDEESSMGKKGIGVKEYLKDHETLTGLNDYAKDRLGIILLSTDNNALAISKEVTNTNKSDDKTHTWTFNITFTPNKDSLEEFGDSNTKGFDLKWYTLDETSGNWNLDASGSHADTIKFGELVDGKCTATLKLKHNEKVVISGLQEGTWQVTEKDETGTILYSPHNNANGLGEEEWLYRSSNVTNTFDLQPNSHVDFVNEFPHELPAAGGSGINFTIYCCIIFAVAAGLYFVMNYKKSKSRDEPER